jgi:Flp pilus assembly protein TadB
MNLQIVAAIGGALAVAGAVVGISAFLGASGDVAPQTHRRQLVGACRRLVGHGLPGAERRVRRLVLSGGAVAGAVAWLATGVPVAGLLAALAVPGTPWLFTVGAAEREAIATVAAIGDWTRRLADLAGTGMGLGQAVVTSAATAPQHLREPVAALAARIQAGDDPEAALLAFADELADPTCDQVVAALILHLADTGQRLGEVLSTIAAAAAAEAATRREVDAKRTQPRFAVRFLTGMTVVVLAYGASRPTYMRPYTTVTGQLVLACLGAVLIGLLVWVRVMSQPALVPRLLTPHSTSSGRGRSGRDR